MPRPTPASLAVSSSIPAKAVLMVKVRKRKMQEIMVGIASLKNYRKRPQIVRSSRSDDVAVSVSNILVLRLSFFSKIF